MSLLKIKQLYFSLVALFYFSTGINSHPPTILNIATYESLNSECFNIIWYALK